MGQRRVDNLIAKRIQVSNLVIDGVETNSAVLLGSGQVVDLNGEADALVIDADADTTISSPTDDQIDFEIAGADDFRMTANTFTALSGSTIATNTIAETTAASGVTIDGVLVKDGGVTQAAATALATDIISEVTAAAGVTVDSVLLKDGYSTGAREPLTLTATGAITAKKHGLAMLSHATVIIAATLAAPTAGDDLVIVNTSASGTVAHTVKAAAGVTFDGTNNTLTLDAPEEAVHLVALSATRWKIMENIGSVGLSST
jgi:hypothetical protein